MMTILWGKNICGFVIFVILRKCNSEGKKIKLRMRKYNCKEKILIQHLNAENSVLISDSNTEDSSLNLVLGCSALGLLGKGGLNCSVELPAFSGCG